MKSTFSRITLLFAIIFSFMATGCNKDDDDLRKPADILGVWSPDSSRYLKFNDDNTVHILTISDVENETIGSWTENVYLYEPGYNLVIYLDFPNEVTVYQVVTLTESKMVWCPVKTLREEYENGESIGNIIGQIINEAQAGFKLDPELFISYYKVTEEKFLNVLEELDITYPW